MHQRSICVVAVIAIALVTTLAGADRASAAGAVLIDACQTLSDADTTYKLTTDLTSCGTSLVVAADNITIDLQGHSVTSSCAPPKAPASPLRRTSSTNTPSSRTAASKGTFSGSG